MVSVKDVGKRNPSRLIVLGRKFEQSERCEERGGLVLQVIVQITGLGWSGLMGVESLRSEADF